MKRVIKGCTGKVRHRNLWVALKVRDEMLAKYPDKRFECYRCWCCKHWHIGRVRGKIDA